MTPYTNVEVGVALIYMLIGVGDAEPCWLRVIWLPYTSLCKHLQQAAHACLCAIAAAARKYAT